MASMDVFNSNAFGMASLSTAIQIAPHKPKLLGGLGIFTDTPIRTPVAFIEKRDGKLSVLATANRGTVMDVRSSELRKAFNFNVPHIPQYQSILADDIYGVRAFGSETELQAMASYVNDQLVGMKSNHEATWEYHRIGALKGTILDSNGTTVIYNLFTEFGLTQVTILWKTTDVTYATTATAIIRAIAEALGADSFSGITVVCGKTYFDALVSHPSMEKAYERWMNGEFLRVSHLGPEWYAAAMNGFMYQNVLFINYRGKVSNLTYLADAEAYAFPTGVDGLFTQILAPADFTETVNTRGQLLYAKQERMLFDKGIQLHTQSNALMMCTRPNVVIKSTWTAS